MSMMAAPSKLQDCYFYFYSSCTKGDDCPFRHCELALGTETVCSLWREGRCFRSNCKFRHMESRINRSTIPCYWENQPGGCRKPHCVFFHRKLRNGVQVVKDAPGLILPTSDGKVSPELSDAPTMPNKVSLTEKTDEGDVVPDHSLAPVPPLVLSFDEGEESDTESVTSTPVKRAAIARNATVKSEDSAEDFGIKTLEQIRMEKIHKESDSFYGAAYTSPPLDASRLIDQLYPPKSEFLALPIDSSLDKSSPAPVTEAKLSAADEENDLRDRLTIRRNAALSKVNQVKRLINFKKQNANQMEENFNKLDFKIKTLEEIRKEKGSKQNKPEVEVVLNSLQSSLEGKKPTMNTKQKLKINRKTRELCSALQKQDVLAPNLTETTKTHMASNGIQKMLPDEPNEKPSLNGNSSDSPGKRKMDDNSCMPASKVMKTEPIDCDDSCMPASKVMKTEPIECDDSWLPDSKVMKTEPNDCDDSCTLTSKIMKIEPNNCERVDQDMYGMGKNHLQQSENQPSSGAIVPSSLGLEHGETTTSATKTAMNGDFKSSSQQPAVKPSPPSNVTSSKTLLNSSVLTKSNNDSSIGRSTSVDDELDELLGDDNMTVDEMDTATGDDILLQIEEFLES